MNEQSLFRLAMVLQNQAPSTFFVKSQVFFKDTLVQ